jgi:hypothetical protein
VNESFRVGDLACVVRTCCAVSFGENGGRIGTIAWVGFRTTNCKNCGAKNTGLHAASAIGRNGAPFPWLKRIDPDPEGRDTFRQKKMALLA